MHALTVGVEEAELLSGEATDRRHGSVRRLPGVGGGTTQNGLTGGGDGADLLLLATASGDPPK